MSVITPLVYILATYKKTWKSKRHLLVISPPQYITRIQKPGWERVKVLPPYWTVKVCQSYNLKDQMYSQHAPGYPSMTFNLDMKTWKVDTDIDQSNKLCQYRETLYGKHGHRELCLMYSWLWLNCIFICDILSFI